MTSGMTMSPITTTVPADGLAAAEAEAARQVEIFAV